MKTLNIFKSIALCVALVAVAACEQQIDGGDNNPGNVTPVFPELVENYAVEPGSVQELVFTPNLDWKISIPSEMRQWFWIQDGTFKVTELARKASQEPITVEIGVTENAEFDRNFSCDVTLEMGDSVKVIAKYMLPAKEKTMEVYSAKILSDTEFEMGEDGISYVYSADPSTEVTFIWSEADADFRLPVKVVSNCDWTVELPEWADVNVPETTTGIVESVFKGESIEGASGKILFKSGENILKELAVSIPSCSDVALYSAQMKDGEFEYGEGGEYLWTESVVSKVVLAWMGSDFRIPIKVDARCNWTLQLPEWLTVELPEKTAGSQSVTLMGVPSKYPLEDTSGLMVFKNGNTVLSEVEVVIPGCKDIMSFGLDMSLTELDFNYLGRFKTTTGYVEGSVSGHLRGTKNVRVLAVETTGNKVGTENPEWLKVEVSNWNTATGADVLQERTITVTASENKGSVRSAVLFVLPPSVDAKVSELFNKDASVKEEYVKYSIPVIQASNVYDEYIVINQVENPQFVYTFTSASEAKKEELMSVFGQTDFVYVLNYESPYCSDEAYMTMAVEFASYKIFDGKDSSADMSGNADFWLKYRSGGDSNDFGVMDMYSNMELPVKQSVGYVVFYGADDKVLAIVECQSPFEEEVLEIEEIAITFTPDAAEHKINITSNVAWTAISDAEWCKVSPSEGLKNGSVTISVAENESNIVRTAVVTIKSEGITKMISIEQKFGEVLDSNLSEMEFDCLSASGEFTVTSNVAWTIVSDSDWCTVSPNSGSADAKVKVTVSRNITDAVRTARLTLKSDNLSKTVTVSQKYDDGSTTNGDDKVHFVDWNAAKSAGAVLERLTSGDIYKKYKDGNVPVYHLTYTTTTAPLRIVLPKEIITHNVNPYSNATNFMVNDTNCYEDFGPNDILGEVVMDADSSVKISMTLPDGKTFLRGNINFTEKSSDTPVIILVCTIDVSVN